MKKDPQQFQTKIRKEFEITGTPNRTKISLWFDDYTDIFSDFDPRSYLHRAISDDFLNELKKVVAEVKNGKFDLIFLIPGTKRNHVDEKIIISRLQRYFHHEANNYQSYHKKLVKKGILLTILGMAMMITTALLVSSIEESFFSKLLAVIFEPTGWFTTWYGLDHIFYMTHDNKEILSFSKKMLSAEISFDQY